MIKTPEGVELAETLIRLVKDSIKAIEKYIKAKKDAILQK